MQSRYTPAELQTITNVREAWPDLSQRCFANKICEERVGREIRSTHTFGSVYGLIRRLDAAASRNIYGTGRKYHTPNPRFAAKAKKSETPA